MDKKDLFINKIQNIFGNKYNRVLQHLYVRPKVSFRLNKRFTNFKDISFKLRQQGFEVSAGPLENSYIVDNSPLDKKFSELDIVQNGEVYIQSLSSMLPVVMLSPQEGDSILDLCAAPGSKTSQIADMTNDNAHIVAVDNNRKRIYKLTDNLKNQKLNNVDILYADGSNLYKRYKQYINYFDKILLDAPCSNEGLICLAEPESFDFWNPKLPKKLSKLQKKLAASAIAMLKSGGTLVYSTCTFSQEENEQIVAWVLARFKNMSLVEVKKVIPDGQFTAFFAAKFVKLG